MNIQLKRIISAIGALGKLSATDLPLKTAYNVKKSIDLLQKEVDFFNQERKKLLEKYGTENEDGSFTLREDTLLDAQRSMEELLAMEVAPDITAVSIPLDDGIRLSANDIEALTPFVTFTETE